MGTRRIFFLVASLALLLGGCQSPTPIPEPTDFPEAVVMQVTPGLRIVNPILQACAAEDPDLALFLEETPKTAINLDSRPAEGLTRLGLVLGEPLKQSFSAMLAGAVEIAVITHPSNPVQKLSPAELQGLFSGQLQNWTQLGGSDQVVTPWVLTPADESRQLFEQIILGEEKLSGQARLAADPAWMLAGISGDPGAVGYLPAAWLAESVKSIEMDPSLAAELRLPLLALADSEPLGAARRLLVCLQNGNGQQLLSKVFQSP